VTWPGLGAGAGDGGRGGVLGGATGDHVDELRGRRLVSGVCAGERGALHRLRGHGHRQTLPAADGGQVLVELPCRVLWVHDLGDGAPALGRALLEQPDRVVIGGDRAVVQAGLLHRGGDGDDPAAGRDVHLLAGLHDDGGVGDLVGGVAGHLAGLRSGKSGVGLPAGGGGQLGGGGGFGERGREGGKHQPAAAQDAARHGPGSEDSAGGHGVGSV
jgi:hypothetical protein